MSPPQPDLVYFTDRCLAKRFPRRLAEVGLNVVPYHDPRAFAGDPTAPDEAWIRYACERGYVALTHDNAIRKDESLAPLFEDHEPTGALFILRGGVTFDRLAQIFLQARSEVEKMVRRYRRQQEPFVAMIRRKNIKGGGERPEVSRWKNRLEWQEFVRRKRRKKKRS